MAKNPTILIACRLPSDLVDFLDQVARDRSEAGLTVTRSDALRMIVTQARDGLGVTVQEIEAAQRIVKEVAAGHRKSDEAAKHAAALTLYSSSRDIRRTEAEIQTKKAQMKR